MKRIHWIEAALILVVLASFVAAPLPAEASPAPMSHDPRCARFYVVQFGDRLARIARRFGTAVRTLTALNALANSNRILFGQVLCVRGTSRRGSAGFLYVVRRGDTLSALGRRFGWRALFLAKLNQLANPNRIFVGEVLFIPRH
jgi:lysozyme